MHKTLHDSVMNIASSIDTHLSFVSADLIFLPLILAVNAQNSLNPHEILFTWTANIVVEMQKELKSTSDRKQNHNVPLNHSQTERFLTEF